MPESTSTNEETKVEESKVEESKVEESKDDKPAEQADLTNGGGKDEGDKTDGDKPEETDSTASRKRPREENEEGSNYNVFTSKSLLL